MVRAVEGLGGEMNVVRAVEGLGGEMNVVRGGAEGLKMNYSGMLNYFSLICFLVRSIDISEIYTLQCY